MKIKLGDKMIGKSLLAASVALGLAGCATPIKVSIDETFDSAAAAEMLKPGPNTIKGSALIRQNGGEIKEIVLSP